MCKPRTTGHSVRCSTEPKRSEVGQMIASRAYRFRPKVTAEVLLNSRQRCMPMILNTLLNCHHPFGHRISKAMALRSRKR